MDFIFVAPSWACNCVFRYWALAVPAYAMVTVFLAMGFYLGVNFMVTPAPTSLNTMFGKPQITQHHLILTFRRHTLSLYVSGWLIDALCDIREIDERLTEPWLLFKVLLMLYHQILFNSFYFADEYSREPSSFIASSEGIEQPIEPISDIPLSQINDLMFGRCNENYKKLKEKV